MLNIYVWKFISITDRSIYVNVIFILQIDFMTMS